MRTIRKSDVIFNLDTKHVYVQDFNAKFFTVNEKDYFIEYSSADVVTTEKEGEIIYSLNLDWKRLRNVGKGVLVFKCINNIPDEDFPDGSYNSEYKITTDYFIDTFEVEPEEHESIVELIEEETENRISGDTFLSGAIDAVDAKVDAKADKATTYTKTEVDTALADKANTATTYTKSEVYSKTEIDNLVGTGFSSSSITDVINENEEIIASALTDLDARKLDASAYTPTDLSNYYTKSETSGKTEIQTALAAKANTATTYTKIDVDTALALKQNTLVSGTNIKTINNESILGSGNIDIQGGSNVISLTQAEYDALETIDPDAMYIISDAAEVDMSNYYTKAQTNTIVGGKQDTLVSGTNIKTINNESILGSGNIDIQGGSNYTAGEGIDITNDVISVTGKVDTTAITTSVTSASTDSQVPSAKAVNDKLGGLSLVKLTQAEYDALETKDPNTLYIIVKSEPKHDYSKDYLTFVVTTGGNIGFSESTTANTLSYSKDNGETWNTADSATTIPVAEGDRILWKGTATPIQNAGIGRFIGDTAARYSVEGNAMSLLFGDDFKNQTSLEGKTYALYSLFSGNTNVTSAENLSLPATTLADSCYQNMFSGCRNLTTAPQLPALNLTESCYLNMFNGCTSLATAPELPATTLAQSCYSSMFSGCTSLTTAPELPATTLASNCYQQMFMRCTRLTTAPSILPATTLPISCYQTMFKYCTSLTTAPELPATTLKRNCYRQMFEGCTSINSITCFATDISADLCTDGWVTNVAASGTFTKAASMTSWTEGTSGIPSGWTVVDKQ